LRLGSRRVVALSIVAVLAIVPLALFSSSLVGGLFGEVFFGAFALDLAQPAALAPAFVFAASNAVAEELAYRGAMRAWLTPSLGIIGANLAQAILFGLSHTGDDFVSASAAIPTAAAMVLAGFVGGVIVRRTRSLSFVLAVHLAADIPLFYYYACRAG
jgi:membrane protease YdiL (CAAX protease family)